MATMLLLSLFLVCMAFPSVIGFIPFKFFASTLQAVERSPDAAITHSDMSRAAVLNVAADLLRANPNPASEGSSSRISSLSSLSEESLVTAYYGESQPGITRTLIDAIEVMNDANTDVDLGGEGNDAASHFDSEQFQTGQNRLVELRQNIVAQILMGNFDLARRETGRLFHTLQDFYSHSNWIENGNTQPYRILGEVNERPGNIADRDTQTCVDCEAQPMAIIDFLSISSIPYIPYSCPDNIVSNLRENGILTTGYAVQNDINGQPIIKPPGKCSHGGYLDTTSHIPARGGINKDSPYESWSPHFMYYDEAARVAEVATVNLLQAIRSDVNDDQLFGMYLGIGVTDVISITYVIDTTASMGEELTEIQQMMPTLRSNLQQYINSFIDNVKFRYILVSFGDPDVGSVFDTEDIEEFFAMIAGLTASGGGSTPDPSIGAIIRALHASEPGSPVYVFTDAPPSDGERFNEAKTLILNKNVRLSVFFVNSALTKRSLKSRSRRQVGTNSIYESLAAFSGGQFFNVRTSEISELASLIGFFAVQSRTTIFRRSQTVEGTVAHSFSVDSSLVGVTISINGEMINVSVSAPQGVDPISLPQYSTSLVSTTSYIAHINVSDDSLRGEWMVMIDSDGSYSMQVFGTTSDLSFSNFLFSLGSSGLVTISGKPTQGFPLIVLISVEGNPLTTINELNLINNNGALSSHNLTRLDSNSYFALVLPPPDPFVLQLVGVDSNEYSFSLIQDTSKEVSTIDLRLGQRETGFVTMRPRESRTVTLQMRNLGLGAEFSMTVNTAVVGNGDGDFEYTASPTTAFRVEQNNSAEIGITITVFSGAADGLAITFIVTVEAVNDMRISDFITFSVYATTRPPPEFTENMVFTPTPTVSSAPLIAPMMLMELFLVIIVLRSF